VQEIQLGVILFVVVPGLETSVKASFEVGSLGSDTLEIILESLEIPTHDYACKYYDLGLKLLNL
jgi:hypothetical protein